MAKKKKVLKADTIVKNYWRDNARFADLFNAVLFQGRVVIRPEELEDVDTDESFVLEHRGHAQSIQQARDNIKICKRSAARGVQFVMLGNEGQEHVHYGMPMRVMEYDYGTYQKQYDDKVRKYKEREDARKEMDRDEILSGIKKTDALIPVITVVVYYGEKPWDGATSLHGMLGLGEDIAPFVNDYKLLLVEARKNDLKLHNIDNMDLFNLLGIFLDGKKPVGETKEHALAYVKQHKVDKSVIMTAAGVANRVIDYGVPGRKGEDVMCTFFEKLKEEGVEEGRAEGIISMGLAYGLSEDDILTQLQKMLDVPLQKAKKYMERFGKQMA
ncbi:MAG: transposase [Lachnospiraceae bacterium]|nr:transposase [Lachnospiraceae bacterium]